MCPLSLPKATLILFASVGAVAWAIIASDLDPEAKTLSIAALICVGLPSSVVALGLGEAWAERRREPEQPFGDTMPSDQAIAHLRKRNGRTLS